MSAEPPRLPATAAPSRALRVGIIGTRGVPNLYGGFERFVELLVEERHWAGTGIEFVIYGEAGEGRYNAVTELVKLPYLKRVNPLLYYVRAAWLASRDCDVVLCCGVALSTFAFIPRLRGKALVINPDGCEWRRTKWPWWIRLIVRAQYAPALWAAQRIVVDAEALKADFGLERSPKCSYIGYQAPEPRSFPLRTETRTRLKLEREFVLIIARLEPENNVVMALQAFARICAPDVECVVVAPTNTPHYQAVLSSMASPTIRFVGGIFDQQVLNELRSNCMAYVHGHSVGGTNPSLLEALSTVTGVLLCHRNRYNEEAAGSEARYFSDASELSTRLGEVLLHRPRRTPSRDPRFHPDEIARRYGDCFVAVAR